MLVVLPAVAICWRPVVTRVQTFRHAESRVAVIDGSRSMATPLKPAGLARRLDLVSTWEGRPLAGRSLDSRLLADRLAALAARAKDVAAGLERSAAEAEQGLPPGPDADATAADHAALVAEVRGDLGGLIASLQAKAAGLPDSPAMAAVAEPLAALEAAGSRLLAPGGPQAGSDPAAALPSLAAFLAAAERVAALLDAAQDSLDTAFLATPAAAGLEAKLTEADRRSRREFAALAARSLPADFAVETAAEGSLSSDLYQMVSRAAAAGEETSDVVLLSDGAHNGGEDDGILRRLAERGVRLSTVPAGLSGPAAIDAALVDWRLPRVLVAAKPAVLRAEIKAPAGAACSLAVRLAGEPAALASTDCTVGADGLAAVALSFKAPAAGRRLLRLSVDCQGDTNAGNNSAVIAVDVAARSRSLLSIDDVPSWDGVWLGIAAERQGIGMTQVHLAGEEPKRGGLSRSVPQTLMQWTRFRGVVLGGPVFRGFSADDAAVLREFVADKGGALLLLAGDANGYAGPLGKVFGFEPPPADPLPGSRVRFAAGAEDQPCLRLASDGPHSARLFDSLPAARAAYRVPRGDVVLLETADGEPVCSLEFHGHGKVIHWGLRGMETMRAFAAAALVDRLLEGLVGELAAPLFPEGTGLPEGKEPPVAFHPPLPRVGSDCLAVAATGTPKVEVGGVAVPPLGDGKTGIYRIRAAAETTPMTVDGRAATLVAHDNPGIETALADVDEKFLRGMADGAKGRLVPALRIAATLGAEEPKSYTSQTSRSWPVGRSFVLVGWLAVAAAAHWVLRKLAGLSI